MKKSGAKVPVQKGTIISNPPTIKQMPYTEKVSERRKQLSETRKGQRTDLATPKGRRK
jgi:hypothetical protein